MKIKSPYLVKAHTSVRLSHLRTDSTGNLKSVESAAPLLLKHRDAVAELQNILYAGQQHAVLVVLQGMDTAGKDGAISHIFSGINPQGCKVTSFKVPTPLEAGHDFLWRVHAAVPARGMIGIFNRSHYEDILVTRVHGDISGKLAARHIEDILAFESILAANGVLILKFFLHISQAEQTRRLQSRIDTPEKHWKLQPADLEERKFWKQYMSAYEEAISATSRKHAPWFIIPSDHKWYRNVAISAILLDALKSLKLKYPAPVMDPATIKL